MLSKRLFRKRDATSREILVVLQRLKAFFKQMHVVCHLMKTSAPALLSTEQADVTYDHSYHEKLRNTYRCLNLTH